MPHDNQCRGEEMRRRPPRLVLITDQQLAGDQLLSRVEGCLSAALPGSVAVQLRDKQLSAQQRLELGRALAEQCRRWDQYLVVNERADLALLLGADGLHLPEGGMTPAQARGLCPTLWLSAACHAPAVDDSRAAVDAWLVSPVISARKGRPALGLAGFESLSRELGVEAAGRLPAVYALGGVDAGNASACLAHGAAGVAVIGAALDGRAVAPLLSALSITR